MFNSDRGGSPQLYVMSVSGGDPQRISFGSGRYTTPVWSPDGSLIAFTKQEGGTFHIGVMRPDGSGERLLTTSYLDEGPTWAPNSRTLLFSRDERKGARLWMVDISGRQLQPAPYGLGGVRPILVGTTALKRSSILAICKLNLTINLRDESSRAS